MSNREETLIPKVGVITDVRIDTPDIKTFRVVTPDGKKAFDHRPGQCAMLSVPGVGEAMFSITTSPTNEEYMEKLEGFINRCTARVLQANNQHSLKPHFDIAAQYYKK